MNKIIAVDFDGTLCENKWPDIGEPNYEVINYLKREQKQGAKLILWTCRCNGQTLRLREAVLWCYSLNLNFDAVNENLPEVIEWMGGDSRKIYADEYIDDRSCTKFKLPFVADEKKKRSEWLPECLNALCLPCTIEKLEEIFGFKLHDWQIEYLLGNDYAIYNNGKRSNGKSFIYCVRKLLDPREGNFCLKNIEPDDDEFPRYFQDLLKIVNNKLRSAGLSTNAIDPWGIVTVGDVVDLNINRYVNSEFIKLRRRKIEEDKDDNL